MHIHKPSCEESTVIVHILELTKRRHREDKRLDKGKKHKRPEFEPRNCLLLSENMNYFHGQINVGNSELNKMSVLQDFTVFNILVCIAMLQELFSKLIRS